MRLDTKEAKGTDGRPQTFFRVAFDPEETRYLASHLNGAMPKLQYVGTIGDGLTIFFDTKGTGLRTREESDGRLCKEGLIGAQYVCGFQGERIPCSPRYERSLYESKPAFYLEKLPDYDRDAGKVEQRVKAEEVFNPAMPAPEPPAPAISTKPALTKRQVKAVVERHSLGTITEGLKDALAHAQGEETGVRTTTVMVERPAKVPMLPQFTLPQKPSTENARRDIKDLVTMINETLAGHDDLFLRTSEDGRQLQVLRRRVVEEAFA